MAVDLNEVLVQFIGKLDTSLLNTFKNLETKIDELVSKLNTLEKAHKKTATGSKQATDATKQHANTISKTTDEYKKYNQYLTKFQKDQAAGLQAAAPLFKNYASHAKTAGESLEWANRKATTMVRGLTQIQHQLTQSNSKWQTWGKNTRGAAIVQAELSGAIKATAQGLQILHPQGQKALRLTNDQARAVGYYTDKNNAFFKSLKQLGTQYAANSTAFREGEKALVKANTAIEKTAAAMTKAGKNGEAFNKTANRLVISKQLLNKTLTTTNGVLTPVAQKLGHVQKQAGLLQRAIYGVADSFKSMARYAAGAMIFYQLFNVFRTGIQSIIDFSQGMRDLQAILNATDNDIARLSETVKEVAQNTKYSTTEVAEGMKLLGQAGLSTTEIMNSIQHVAALATGTMTDFATVSDLVTTTVRAFQLDFRQTGEVVDVFANAINRSKLTVEKLRVAFNYIAPFAKAAGVSFQETTGALMMLANAGIRASTMGTGFRQILIRLLNPTATFTKAIQDAGYSVEDFNPRTNELADIFDRLKVVVPSAAEAVQFFHVRSLPAVMVFASQGGDALRRFMDIISEVGAAARMMETQTKGLGIQFKQIADKFSVLSVSLGQSGLHTVILGLTTGIRKLFDGLIALANNGFTSVVMQVALTAAALKTLGGLFTWLMGLNFLKVIFGWVGGFKTFTTAANVATAAATKAGKSFVVLRGYLAAFWSLLITNWFIALAAAIVGVVSAVTNYINKNNKLRKQLADQISQIKDVADTFSTYIEEIEKAEKENKGYSQILERIIADLPQMANEIKNVVAEGRTMSEWMREVIKLKNEEAIVKVGEQAVAAANDIQKFNPTLLTLVNYAEKVGKEFNFTGGAMATLMAKAGLFDKTIQWLNRRLLENKNALREYITEMLTYHTQQGDTLEEAQNKVRALLEKSNIDWKKHGHIIDEVMDDASQVVQMYLNMMIAELSQMPKVLEDLAKKHSDKSGEIADAWSTAYEEIKHTSDLLGRGMINAEEAADRLQKTQDRLANTLKEVTGDTVNLSSEMHEFQAFLLGTPAAVEKMFYALSGSEMIDFAEDVKKAKREIDALQEALEKLKLNDLQIKFIISEEWENKKAELIGKLTETLRTEYKSQLDIVQQGERDILNIKMRRYEQEIEANRKKLDRQLQDIQRKADAEIAVLDAGLSDYSNIELQKAEIARRGTHDYVEVIRGGQLTIQKFLKETAKVGEDSIYDYVEVVRGGQLTVQRFLKEGVDAARKAEYDKLYITQGIEDEKTRIRQEAFDAQLRAINGHYAKELEIHNQMMNEEMTSLGIRLANEQEFWNTKGEIFGPYLERFNKLNNQEIDLERNKFKEINRITAADYEKRVKIHEDWISKLEGLLQKEISHHEQTVNAILQTRQRLKDLELQRYDEERGINRDYMTDAEKVQDTLKAFAEARYKAEAALAEQNYDDAKKYNERALQFAKELTKEDASREQRLKLVGEALSGLTNVEKAREESLQKELKKSEERMQKLEDQIESVGQRLETLRDMKFELEVSDITESVERAEQQIEELRTKLTDEPLVMTIQALVEGVEEALIAGENLAKDLSEKAESEVTVKLVSETGEDIESYTKRVWDAIKEWQKDSVFRIMFRGEGSDELPLTEKINELSEKFKEFELLFNEADLSVTVSFKSGEGEEAKSLTEVMGDIIEEFKKFAEELSEKPIEVRVEFLGSEGGEGIKPFSEKLDDIAKAFKEFKEKLEEVIKIYLEAKEAIETLTAIIKLHENIPKETTSTHTVNVVGLDLLAQAIAYHKELHGKHTQSTHTIIVRKVGGKNAGGLIDDADVQGYATGGFIPEGRFQRKRGQIPGRGTQDDVPAMLTKGEFVQPVSTVDYYGKGFMEALRHKMIPKDMIPQFNTGGSVWHEFYGTDFYNRNVSYFQKLQDSFPRLWNPDTKLDFKNKLNLSVPKNIQLALEGKGVVGKVQNRFDQYLNDFTGLSFKGSETIESTNSRLISTINELASGMVNRGEMSLQALQKYDFESETILKDLYGQAEYLKDQGHTDLAFKVESLAFELQMLLEDFRDKMY
jgi:TP901 family phage tail tape measure protein